MSLSASVTHFTDCGSYWPIKPSSGAKTEVNQLFQNRSVFNRDEKLKGLEAIQQKEEKVAINGNEAIIYFISKI